MNHLFDTTETSNNAGSYNDNGSRGYRPYTIYLAGDLWTHKDLIGNALLAEYIKSVSRGRYECVLPQDLEEPVNRSVDIRNVDLKHVMTCDMAIFNFDGSNLDAGTVVEFIYAKMIDIPSVILRTDFRAAGEGNQEQDPWNLDGHSLAAYEGGETPWHGRVSGCENSRSARQNHREDVRKNGCGDRREPRRRAPGKAAGERPCSHGAMYQWAIECPGAGYDTLFRQW